MLEKYETLDKVIEAVENSGRLYEDFAEIVTSGIELRAFLMELSDAVRNRDLAIRIWNTAYDLENIPNFGVETPLENFDRDTINGFESAVWEILVNEGLVRP